MDDIYIKAVVKFNNSEAWVLNRLPKFVYIKEGNILYAEDCGFYSCYRYKTPSKSWQAFSGRKFELPLKKGGIEKCYGQWWDAGIGTISKKYGIEFLPLTCNTEVGLVECYVFFGGLHIEREKSIQLRKEYKGVVYPYLDYEKIIKFTPQRKEFYFRLHKLEQAKKSLIKVVKEKHQLLREK